MPDIAAVIGRQMIRGCEDLLLEVIVTVAEQISQPRLGEKMYAGLPELMIQDAAIRGPMPQNVDSWSVLAVVRPENADCSMDYCRTQEFSILCTVIIEISALSPR